LGRVLGCLIGFGATQDAYGVVVGFCVGFMLDSYYINVERPLRKDDSWQTEFSYLFIVLHAKFAKVDGQVTSAEVRAFQDIISVSSEDIETVRAIYNEHRSSADGFEIVAVRLSEMLLMHESVRRAVVQSLCVVGMAEGSLNMYQGAFVQAVGRILAFSDDEIDMMKREVTAGYTGGSNAYKNKANTSSGQFAQDLWFDVDSLKELGLKKGASPEEVRKAYKKAIRAFHPDKLRGEGADDVAVKKAESKLARINEAYAVLTKGK
tara:strand:+ start:259711 stop:260502 length:792 start_codon:yes stop_codon:yes gene_type:complete